MSNYPSSMSLAAAVFATLGTVTSVNANAADQTQQVEQAMIPPTAVTLPEVVVHAMPPDWRYDPYTSGGTAKASSLNHIPFKHFKVPVGYDADVAMHPYTSAFGPCAEGGRGAGCEPWHGYLIKPSRYERPPFTN